MIVSDVPNTKSLETVILVSAENSLSLKGKKAFLVRQTFFIIIFLVEFAVVIAQSPVQSCAKLTLKAPQTLIYASDPIEFYVELRDVKNLETLSFDWKVMGRSFKGQGSSRIQVSTTKEDSSSNITASVTVKNSVDSCSAFLSASAGIAPSPIIDIWEDIGHLKPKDLKGQLDLHFATLENDPTDEGVFEFIFTANQKETYKLSKLNLVYKHILYRRFSPESISFYVHEGVDEGIRFSRMPPGSDYADYGIDPSKLIGAEEFKARIKTFLKD